MTTWRNTAETWGVVARTLHWAIAILILVLMVVGAIMTDMPNSPDKFQIYMMHKSFGLLVLALVVCRVVWRLTSRKPKSLTTVPWYMNAAAEIVHWGLYVLMLLIPISGWLVNSYANVPLNWFGVEGLKVPNLVTPPLEGGWDKAEEIGEVHETLAWLLLAIVGLHVAAALYHHFVRKDPVLARMTPFIHAPKES